MTPTIPFTRPRPAAFATRRAAWANGATLGTTLWLLACVLVPLLLGG